MDKRKLVTIIVKDLEEIRVLTEEVAESQDDSSILIHLALNRARLLCQEIELLHDLTGNPTLFQKKTEEVSFERDEEAVSNTHFSHSELEILNFEEQEFSSPEELIGEEDEDLEETEDEETDDEEEEGQVEEEEEFTEDLEEEEEDLTEEVEDDQEAEQEAKQEEITTLDLEEDHLTDEKAIDVETNEEKEEVDISMQEKEIQSTELKNELQPGMREIHIDDEDDEDIIEPIRFSPLTGSTVRPPMREIPKPDFLDPEKPEKMVMGGKFPQERSLNDSMGENHSVDSNLITGRITSLRAAIGLNDRFLFIREIFAKDSEKYNTVIDHLDKMEQIQEAVEYLKANLSMEKTEASMKFVELLKRRFTK